MVVSLFWKLLASHRVPSSFISLSWLRNKTPATPSFVEKAFISLKWYSFFTGDPREVGPRPLLPRREQEWAWPWGRPLGMEAGEAMGGCLGLKTGPAEKGVCVFFWFLRERCLGIWRSVLMISCSAELWHALWVEEHGLTKETLIWIYGEDSCSLHKGCVSRHQSPTSGTPLFLVTCRPLL